VNKHSRSKERHICAANGWIGDFGVKGRHGDEHYGRHEGGKDVLDNDEQQIGSGGAGGRGENHDNELCKSSSDKTADESPTPEAHRGVLLAPLASIVAEGYLKRKIDKDGQSKVFLRETLFQQFEIGDGVICLETNLGNEMDDDKGLNVL